MSSSFYEENMCFQVSFFCSFWCTYSDMSWLCYSTELEFCKEEKFVSLKGGKCEVFCHSSVVLYAKWNKPGSEGQIPYDLTFNWNMINKDTLLKNSNMKDLRFLIKYTERFNFVTNV